LSVVNKDRYSVVVV